MDIVKGKGKKRKEEISRYPLSQMKISCLFLDEKPSSCPGKGHLQGHQESRASGRGKLTHRQRTGRQGKMEPFREQSSPSRSEARVEKKKEKKRSSG